MKVIIDDTYQNMSFKAANHFLDFVTNESDPLICVASGHTPTEMYRQIHLQINNGTIDTSTWRYVGLDEWIGLDETDNGSCRGYLNKHFFEPLQVPSSSIHCFNGKSPETGEECERMEIFINKFGGLDLAIVGLGMNGHVGLNEPGTDKNLRSHVALIDSVTQETGQKYFDKKTPLKHGITLGIANLMDCKKVMLLVNGSHKAEIVKKVLEGEISEAVPATLLRNHPGCTMYLDKEAASLLKQ